MVLCSVLIVKLHFVVVIKHLSCMHTNILLKVLVIKSREVACWVLLFFSLAGFGLFVFYLFFKLAF